MKVGGLFSGIGAFELGLQRAGFEIAWFCENDKFCQRVLAKHWPDLPCYPDVTDLHGDQVEPVDVLCGGFPCQDLSYAGSGEGLDGSRSGLWSEFARLIGELRPRYVILENVSALLARGLGRVLGELAEIGYDCEWDCLPASAFGAPHQRDRIWIVAYPGRERSELRGGSGDLVCASGAAEGEGLQRERGGSAVVDRGAGGPGMEGKDSDSDVGGFEGVGFTEPRGIEGAQGSVSDGLCEDGGFVDSPLSDANGSGCEERRRAVADAAQFVASERDGEAVADSEREGLQGLSGGGVEGEGRSPVVAAGVDQGRGGSGSAEPDFCGMADGPSEGLDHGGWDREWEGIPRVVSEKIPNRVARLQALGNALVPQIAEYIGRRVLEYESR